MKTIGNPSRKQVHDEVDRTAIAGVLDLRDVFQLVDDALNDGPLAEQELVTPVHQLVFHVGLEFGDQFDVLGAELVR